MEFLLLVVEFFVVKGFRSILWSMAIPIAFGFLIFYLSDDLNYCKNASDFHTNVITVLSILVGFSISTFTMLLTVSNENVDKAKRHMLKREVFSKKLSLYDSVLIGLAYAIFIQALLLIANFIYPIFIVISSLEGKLMFAINISIMIHVVIVIMRSVLDFYFILSKKEE